MKTETELVSEIHDMEGMESELRCNLAVVKHQLSDLRRELAESKRCRVLDLQRYRVKRVIDGEKITDVAKSFGVTPASIRRVVLTFCYNANRTIYKAGLNRNVTPHKATPSIKYLRDNKAAFGL
jgi:hypothetical protein